MELRKLVSVFAASIVLTAIAAASPVNTAGILTYVGMDIAGNGHYLDINPALSTTCARPHVFIATSAPEYGETVSTLLSALSQGKQIALFYDNAAICVGGGGAALPQYRSAPEPRSDDPRLCSSCMRFLGRARTIGVAHTV